MVGLPKLNVVIQSALGIERRLQGADGNDHDDEASRTTE